jgi:hypothetical protein
MTNTSINPLVVVRAGVVTRLDTLAYNISTKGGIGGSMAPLRGESAVVPGRSGSIYRKGRRRDEGKVILNMWAVDNNEGGVRSTDPYLVWRSNMDKLLMLFDTSNEQIELREYITRLSSPGVALPASGYRRAMVEVRSAIDPEILGRVFGKFVVECIINETYWEDYQEQTWTSPIGLTAVGTHSMTPFNGMTAPIEDAEITVTGAGTNPRVTDPRTGHWLQLNQALASGASWVVNCRNWTSTIGGVSQTATTTSSGPFSPGPFGISANDGLPKIQFSATGANASTKVAVKARRKFH